VSGSQWIVVRNWERFQHYSDRSPSWIKSYTAQLHDPDYLTLSSHCRAVLEGVRLAYASSNGQLLLNTRSLSAQLALRVMSRDIEALIHAGFIEVSASRPLALRYPREETETEKRQKKRSPLTPAERGHSNGTPRDRGTSPRAQGTNPRALDQNAKEERHFAMVSVGWEESRSWEETRTDLLHERLDALESRHGAMFTDQERDEIIDAVLERTTVGAE
jgi:hypothetical protein